MSNTIQNTAPNFFVLGAAKAGTTAIWSWLQQHDDVFHSSLWRKTSVRISATSGNDTGAFWYVTPFASRFE